MPTIKKISCDKIINSRGDWTIETKVELDDGSLGIQTIPDGASKGLHEAVYIPVDKSIQVVSTVIDDALRGDNPYKQKDIDELLINMDGTTTKKHLGGNSILSVSLAVAKASAMSKNLQLFEYLHEIYTGQSFRKNEIKIPTPIFNIINGGKHAHNNLSFQEFMIIPTQDMPFTQQMEMGVNIYRQLKNDLESKKHDVDVGDEGGFAPNNFTAKKALDFIMSAAKKDYKPGINVFLGMDVAAGSFYRNSRYEIEEEKLHLNYEKLQIYYSKILTKYPLIYLEDPFYEEDYESWKEFFKVSKDKLMVVGDDLVVTNTKILSKALEHEYINAVIVKPNQVGTLTETLEFIKLAREGGLSIIVSHRSGDTAEDTFIADLSVAVNADFIKSGAPVRGERVAKYNRLLNIYDDYVPHK